ncbi:MAG: tyrosine-type recombinase/integrase [Clostridia bacterium]
MGRRAKGSGSIFQRSNGYFVARYEGKDIYGKTKLEVSDKLDTYKAELKAGGSVAKDITIAQAMPKWLAHKALTIKPSSFDRLEETVNKHIIPTIGTVKCCDFTDDIFVTKVIKPMMAKGLSYSSIKKTQDVICPFCKWACAPGRRYMAFDPMASFEKIKKFAVEKSNDEEEETADTVVYIEKEGRERFKAACRAKLGNGKPRFKYGEHFIFCMYTGLRMGELLALTWDNVDLEKKRIRVDSAVYLVKDRDPKSKTFGKKVLVVNKYTKNNKPRPIPLGNVAYEAIQNILAEKGESKYVTHNKDGGLVLASVFSSMLERVYDLASITIQEGTNVHALRHTFASMCFEAGMNVRVISELLGHSSVQITMDIYIHLITDKNLESIPELKDLQ